MTTQNKKIRASKLHCHFQTTSYTFMFLANYSQLPFFMVNETKVKYCFVNVGSH